MKSQQSKNKLHNSWVALSFPCKANPIKCTPYQIKVSTMWIISRTKPVTTDIFLTTIAQDKIP